MESFYPLDRPSLRNQNILHPVQCIQFINKRQPWIWHLNLSCSVVEDKLRLDMEPTCAREGMLYLLAQLLSRIGTYLRVCSSFSTRKCPPGHNLIQLKAIAINKHSYHHQRMELKGFQPMRSSGWRLHCLLCRVDGIGPQSLFSHLKENCYVPSYQVEQKACIFYVNASFPKS